MRKPDFTDTKVGLLIAAIGSVLVIIGSFFWMPLVVVGVVVVLISMFFLDFGSW